MSKKIARGILIFGSMLSLMFEKGMSKKIAPGILRFASMLYLRFEQWWAKKLQQEFEDL